MGKTEVGYPEGGKKYEGAERALVMILVRKS